MRFIFSILLLSVFDSVLAAEIHGRVLLSEGKKQTSLSHIRVRLHIYKDEQEFSGMETFTNAQGKYSFRGLDTSPRFAYIAYPIYQDVNYPFEEIVFAGSTRVAKDFKIAKPTGSTKDLVVEENVFFELGQKDMWKITNHVVVRNLGDQLYHPDLANAEPLLISLFEKGFDLSLIDGIERSSIKIDDQNDTLQVFLTIGSRQAAEFSFSYFYYPEKRLVKFKRPAYLSHSTFNLFFNRHLTVHSEQFQKDEALLANEPEFKRAFSSGPILKNNDIQFEITGFYLQRDLLHILLFVTCLLFVIFIVYFSIQSQKIVPNDKKLEQEMMDYLRKLQKENSDGQFTKEIHRVQNFLFQASKGSSKR